MTIITKQEQYKQGHWYTWVNTEGFNTIMLETPYQMSENEAITFRDKYLDDHLYDDVNQFIVTVYNFKEVIRNAIAFIKINNPNLTQWNGYISSQPWDESLMVRWFLARLALGLADRKEFDLSVFTETEVLSKLKTWIIATPARKLEKILFSM